MNYFFKEIPISGFGAIHCTSYTCCGWSCPSWDSCQRRKRISRGYRSKGGRSSPRFARDAEYPEKVFASKVKKGIICRVNFCIFSFLNLLISKKNENNIFIYIKTWHLLINWLINMWKKTFLSIYFFLLKKLYKIFSSFFSIKKFYLEKL